jgi:hypothetical protein
MSKKQLNITNNVMDQIRSKKVVMRPKIYFAVGSVLLFLGTAASIIVSIFSISLIKFMLRTHGPMGQYRLDQILSSFPWWAPVLAFVGILVGTILIKKYDFSYKNNFFLIIIGFVISIFIAGLVIDSTGIDNTLFGRGFGRQNGSQTIQNGSRIRYGR